VIPVGRDSAPGTGRPRALVDGRESALGAGWPRALAVGRSHAPGPLRSAGNQHWRSHDHPGGSTSGITVDQSEALAVARSDGLEIARPDGRTALEPGGRAGRRACDREAGRTCDRVTGRTWDRVTVRPWALEIEGADAPATVRYSDRTHPGPQALRALGQRSGSAQ
jgi:hypothetical protein